MRRFFTKKKDASPQTISALPNNVTDPKQLIDELESLQSSPQTSDTNSRTAILLRNIENALEEKTPDPNLLYKYIMFCNEKFWQSKLRSLHENIEKKPIKILLSEAVNFKIELKFLQAKIPSEPQSTAPEQIKMQKRLLNILTDNLSAITSIETTLLAAWNATTPDDKKSASTLPDKDEITTNKNEAFTKTNASRPIIKSEEISTKTDSLLVSSSTTTKSVISNFSASQVQSSDEIYLGYNNDDSFISYIWKVKEGLEHERKLKNNECLLRASQRKGLLTLSYKMNNKILNRYITLQHDAQNGYRFIVINSNEMSTRQLEETLKKLQETQTNYDQLEDILETTPKLCDVLTKLLFKTVTKHLKLENFETLKKGLQNPNQEQASPTYMFFKFDTKSSKINTSLADTPAPKETKTKLESPSFDLSIFNPDIRQNMADLKMTNEYEAFSLLNDLNLLNKNHSIMRTPAKFLSNDNTLELMDIHDNEIELKIQDRESQETLDTFYKLIISHEILAAEFLNEHELAIAHNGNTQEKEFVQELHQKYLSLKREIEVKPEEADELSHKIKSSSKPSS